ncbi:hypothetical protein [Blautia stercoris]
MKKMDKDGMLLCELQAKTFELSLKLTETSSEIFIRRFMNSDVVKELDNTSFFGDKFTAKRYYRIYTAAVWGITVWLCEIHRK